MNHDAQDGPKTFFPRAAAVFVPPLKRNAVEAAFRGSYEVRLVPDGDGWFWLDHPGAWRVLGPVVREVFPSARRRFGTGRRPGWHVQLVLGDEERFASALAVIGWRLEGHDAPMPEPDGRLLGHQREGVRWLLARDIAILADEPGLGKTATVLDALRLLGAWATRVLILCPAGLVPHWKREAERWPGRRLRDAWKEERERFPPDWWIASIDEIKGFGCSYDRAMATCWDVVVVDEAHVLRTEDSARSGFASRLRATRRWFVTATPIWNRPRDLWSLLQALRHPWTESCEQDSATRFEERWFGSEASLSRLHDELLGDIVLARQKRDVVELPPLVVREQWIHVLKTWRTERPPSLGDLATARMGLALHKAASAAEWIQGRLAVASKVAVFSEHPKVLARIRGMLPDVRSVVVDGSMFAHARQAAADAFQSDPSVRVFFGQTTAAGVGLNLSAASEVLIVDLSWAPSAHAQAIQRCHRLGSTRPVTATFLLADCPIDRATWRLLEDKQRAIGDWDAVVRPADALVAMVRESDEEKHVRGA